MVEEKEEEERKVEGTGKGRVIGWGRMAMVNYTRCRTGKGNLLGCHGGNS